MCPACSIRQKLLLPSTPLGALATAVTNPAQILTHTTAELLVQTELPLLCPAPAAILGVDPQVCPTSAVGLSLKGSCE